MVLPLFISRTCSTGATLWFALLLILSFAPSQARNRKMRPLADEEDDDISVRLPSNLRPIHYVLRLHPFLHGNRTVSGRLEVELEVLRATSRIVFHAADIDIIEDSLRVSLMSKRRSYPVKRQKYNATFEQYIVQMRRRLRQGNTYLLSMHFVSYLRNVTKGFFVTTYRDKGGNERKMAATHFWPAHARRAFPCFDEPEMKASFDIYLAREINMTAISNMQVVRTTPMRGWPGWVWDQFATSFNMSTYLVAFVISDFHHRSLDSEAKMRLEAWTRREALGQTNLALKVANYSLHFYENYFNLSYPLQKMDFVALPKASFSAMENWGLITCRESLFLIDAKNAPVTQQTHLARLVSHEMAHQWFGNLVTPKWWTDLWLSEGFATYMANVAIDKLEPEWGLLNQFVSEKQQDIMMQDGLRSSHPVSDDIPSPDSIFELYDPITYNKGASVIRMMKHFLTESTFQKGLHYFLNTMKYTNADQDDLWRFMTKAFLEDSFLPADVTVKTIMDTWTLQEGYPVITVTTDHNNNAKLKQKRFLLLGDDKEEDTSYKWWVPITFTSQKAPSFRHTRAQTWLSSHADHVIVTGLPPPQFWHIFNIQMSGYYRVNYNEYNWNLLAFQLQEDHEVINVMNRAQIIDDALALARAGLLPYNTALNTTVYLQEERTLMAWRAVFRQIDFLCKMFRYTPSYGALKDYFLSLLEPLYDALGLEDGPEDDLQTQLLRQEVVLWSCFFEHSQCVNTSVHLFQQWIDDPSFRGIPTNVAFPVYCTAISRGSRKEWEFAMQRLSASSSYYSRQALVKALGCASETWLLAGYLQETLQGRSQLRRQDVTQVFDSVANSEVGGFLAWHFLRSNWQELSQLEVVDITTLGHMLSTATTALNREQHLIQVEHLQNSTTDDEGNLKEILKQAVALVESNVSWMERHFDVITTWLKERGFFFSLGRV